MASLDDALQQIQRAVLWATTFAFPIVVLPGVTHDEFKVPKMALLVLGVGLAGSIYLIRSGLGTAERINRRMFAISSILIACLFVSWAFSDLKEWSLVGQYLRYQGLIPYILFAAYGVLMATTFRERYHSIAWALVLSAGMTGLYSIVQAFHLDPLFVFSTESLLQEAASSIGHHNFAGAWHAMAFPIAVGLYLTERGRRRELAAAASIPIMFGILFSFSQAGWVAALGGVLALSGMLLGRARPRLRTAGFVSAGSLGVVLVAVVMSVLVSPGARDFFEVNVQSRAWGWQAAVDSWRSDPLVGRGPNTFALFSYQHSPIEERVRAEAYLDDPHSVPLSFLASSGIVGVAGYAVMLLVLLRTCVVTAVRRADPLLMGLTAAVIAYGIQMLVSIDDPTLRLGLWAASGAVVGAYPGVVEPRAPLVPPLDQGKRIALLSVAGILLLGTSATASWRFLEADRQMSTGLEAALDNDAEDAVDAFRRAVGLRDDAWYRYLAGQNVGQLAARRAAAGEEYFTEMRWHFRSLSVPRHPRDLSIEGLLTNVWAHRVEPDLKARAFSLTRRAHRLDPWNLTYGAGLANLLVAEGKPNEAVVLLQAYVPYNPDSDLFWGSWALANAAAGHHQEAWETIRARELPVGDSRVRRALELLVE